MYFPIIYDLKYIIKDVPSLKDVGLAKLSYEIGCSRIGPQHQAGSDSLLTLCCYFKMLDQNEIFGQRQFQNCVNVIFGIGIGYMKNMIGNYQQREYMDNSYVERNDYGGYYDSRNPMYHMHHQYGLGGNYSGTGPLYNYLQGQSQYHMMYPQQPERRYWRAMILNSLTLYDFLKLSNLFNWLIFQTYDWLLDYQSSTYSF